MPREEKKYGAHHSSSVMEATMIMSAACFLLLVLSAGAAPVVNYCDKQADYAVKVKEVQINPDPVIRGQPAKFSISALTKDALPGGKLLIDVKYFGVHIHQETHELCNETSCPVSGGDFVISHEEVLPTLTPPGTYTLTMKMLGEAGGQLTCVSFAFKIGLGSPVDDI